jgi:hypothetical protein
MSSGAYCFSHESEFPVFVVTLSRLDYSQAQGAGEDPSGAKAETDERAAAAETVSESPVKRE